MKRSNWVRLFPVCLPLLVLGLGCGDGGGSTKGPKTFPVSGKVTQKGQPVEGAAVTFMSADGKKGALGRTDASGRYTLMSSKPGDGAQAGDYKVTVTKFKAAEAAGKSPDVIEESYAPPPETGPGMAAPAPAKKPAGPENLLPAKYADAQSSGLTATVKEGKNEFDFTVD
jgi:hypothetical protein